jgi:hypothetical protein
MNSIEKYIVTLVCEKNNIADVDENIDYVRNKINEKLNPTEPTNVEIKPLKDQKYKKKPTAYNVFMKKAMDKVKKDYPDMDHKNVFKTAASQWKYSSENPGKVVEKKEKEIKKKEKPTAYNIFMKKTMEEIQEEYDELDPKEVFRRAASRWKEAPENKEASLSFIIEKREQSKNTITKKPVNTKIANPIDIAFEIFIDDIVREKSYINSIDEIVDHIHDAYSAKWEVFDEKGLVNYFKELAAIKSKNTKEIINKKAIFEIFNKTEEGKVYIDELYENFDSTCRVEDINQITDSDGFFYFGKKEVQYKIYVYRQK